MAESTKTPLFALQPGAAKTTLFCVVTLGLALAGCSRRITVPIRVCVVAGNEWTRAPDPGPGHFPPPPGEDGYFVKEGTQKIQENARQLFDSVNSSGSF